MVSVANQAFCPSQTSVVVDRYDDDLKSVCVVVPINSETCELKNIATYNLLI